MLNSIKTGNSYVCGLKNVNLQGGTMAISKDLLEILACPKCKGDVYLNKSRDGLICDNCRLMYEIRDDIPIMLIEEAKPLED
jgi:uncharacterized protein